ncbi:sterol esterase [Roridomyces roridus]|uniref:Carboxylic ester hydrolase n=1 Tax=Roridomyces roridus TaxID=1738132 RepID=A0AAD7B185_9AGAR|nr:sterol esterase [Roridomyces roridus]
MFLEGFPQAPPCSHCSSLARSRPCSVCPQTPPSPCHGRPYGTFLGANAGNVTEFLGVPYAQAARFELPQTPATLPGIQNATDFGATCPQQMLSGSSPPEPGPFSEDCLNLDVYRPVTSTAQSKLPVFVWIFGGGFEIGSSRDINWLPIIERSISTAEPILVVSINYRVNAFGFLAGKEVAAAGVTNLGMRDQIFALEWVQQNIAAFGGDPTRVVLGGVSSGAISAGLLLLDNNKSSNTLFHGAFMQSGSPDTSPLVSGGQADYDELVSASGCSGAASTLDCLKQVPFDTIMAAINDSPDIFSFKSLNIVWRPRVDGDLLVQDPLISVDQGKYAQIPFLTGDSDDEGTLFSTSLLNITTSDEFLNYVQSNYLPAATAAQITEIGQLYPDDPTQGSPFDTGTADELSPEFKRLAAFQGDLIFQAPRRFFLEHASSRQNTWSWLNKRFKDSSVLGSTHSSDNTIWFPLESSGDFTATDALINFINTLDPNLPGTPFGMSWPEWNAPSAAGSTSLLTFTDPDPTSGVDVILGAEDFRADAIAFLNGLLLDEAEGM